MASPIVTLTQILTGLTAGTVVSCNAFFNYPGDGDALLEAVQVTMFVDGQFCAQDQSVRTNDWQPLTPGNSITIGNDNPTVQVSIYFDNFFGFQLTAGLDDIRVVVEGESGLPTCETMTPL